MPPFLAPENVAKVLATKHMQLALLEIPQSPTIVVQTLMQVCCLQQQYQNHLAVVCLHLFFTPRRSLYISSSLMYEDVQNLLYRR